MFKRNDLMRDSEFIFVIKPVRGHKNAIIVVTIANQAYNANLESTEKIFAS